jgi:hypothetical protein
MIVSIEVPLYLVVGKKKPKKIAINLNTYRNLYHHQNDDLKKQFRDLIGPELRAKLNGAQFNMLWIHYFIHRNSELLFDTGNISSVLEKFFLDVLKNIEAIPDDNYKHVRFGSYSVNPTKIKTENRFATVYISDEPLFVPIPEFEEKVLHEYPQA